MPKMITAERTLNFTLAPSAPGVATIRFIDIGEALSIVNRRAYRQGMQYVISNITVQTVANEDVASDTNVLITRLPTTWVIGAAWEKSMRHWLKQQDDALAASGSEETAARYRDFKVHLNQTHYGIGWANNLVPHDSYGTPYLKGEWEPSYVVIPNDGAVGNTIEYSLKMLGNDSGLKGVIDGYGQSRNKPANPDPVGADVAESWLNQMFDDGFSSEEITDNAQFNNDMAPYYWDGYPGTDSNGVNAQLVSEMQFTNTTVSRKERTGSFVVPCGLLQIRADQIIKIKLELVPGYYKGVLAEEMQEMN